MENNFWEIDKSSVTELVEEGQLDLGKWFLFYNSAMKEWEATMSGIYTHVFKTLDDLLQRKNEVDLYEYNEELSDKYGEEMITNSQGHERIY
jgi:hypothetical protein